MEVVKLPDPAPLKLKGIKWKVLTPATLPKEEKWVYYSLTVRQYENLANNMAEISRWIKEAVWRLKYYKGEAELNAHEK